MNPTRAILVATLAGACFGCQAPGPTGPKTAAPAIAPAAPDAPWDFEPLAAVLAQTVDEDRLIDATALHAQRPQLRRQLQRLARPWPTEIADAPVADPTRLAWLYNARTAWSLWLVSAHLDRSRLRRDEFVLPDTIDGAAMVTAEFPLAGTTSSLAAIDAELARHPDWRVGAGAPGATDWAGPLPRRPFAPGDLTGRLEERFRALGRSDRRLVTDHEFRKLRVPPALWIHADRIRRAYAEAHGLAVEQVRLQTALGPHLDARGRDRLADALGYEPVVRTGPAGITAASEEPLSQW